jgi:hypothetical protein
MVPRALVDDRDLHGLHLQYGHPASASATRCGAPGRPASSTCRSRGVAVSGRGGRCDARRWRPTGQSVILHRIACMSCQQGQHRSEIDARRAGGAIAIRSIALLQPGASEEARAAPPCEPPPLHRIGMAASSSSDLPPGLRRDASGRVPLLDFCRRRDHIMRSRSCPIGIGSYAPATPDCGLRLRLCSFSSLLL